MRILNNMFLKQKIKVLNQKAEGKAFFYDL
jgi:hypothetical protein